MRFVTLPAIGKTVSLKSYVAFVKTAKENPELQFKHGLTCWWSCSGYEIMKQFTRGMNDRINQAVPYSKRA